MSSQESGRVFFSSVRRSLEVEDEIRLLSVGVDIGSSTSHLAFSRLVLERLDNRYIVSERQIIHESEICLTPYADDRTIDADALGAFIEEQYRLAGIEVAQIDTGALILTGVAMRRRNARAVADLFAAAAGKFVSVSAGDALETRLAAFGSGAAARSIREGCRVMNIDIGGGTSKVAVCEGGEIVEMTAIDIGARLLCLDDQGRICRIEDAALRFASELDISLEMGAAPPPAALDRLAERMAERLFETISQPMVSQPTAALLRLAPLENRRIPDVVTFSGGVSEYIYGVPHASVGDMGPALGRAISARVDAWGVRIERPDQGIRATVVGASQYTVQVSGSTIFVSPLECLPVRNVAVIAPDLDLDAEIVDADAIAASVRHALHDASLDDGEQPVALGYHWRGSAMFLRMEHFCRGVIAGLDPVLRRGLPLILVGESDIGGLLGIRCGELLGQRNPIISIDGIQLRAFDFIDIGVMLETSGAVPVVIKSLVFPASPDPGTGV